MTCVDNKCRGGVDKVAFSPLAPIAALHAPPQIADSSAPLSRGFSLDFGRRLYENAYQFFNGSWACKSAVDRLYPQLLEDLDEAESLHSKGRIRELQLKLEKIDQTIGKIFPKSVFWSHLKEMRQFLF